MKKITRAVVYAIGAIIALFAILLLAVNLYVQSQPTQARIQRELSERLGTTLRIQRISVTPWWGLKLRGITIPQTDATVERDFLQADTFRLRIRFLSLFAQELVIKEVALVHPTVVWAQNSDGKWRIPSALPSRAAEPSSPPENPAGVSTDDTQPIKPSLPPRNVEPQQSSFTPEVRRVALTDGNFYFLDAKERPVAAFEGLRFRSNVRHSSELSGSAEIAKISLRDRFFLEQLKSPVIYDADHLELSNIIAAAAKGIISGSFTMRQTEPGSPFEAKVTFREIDADRLVSDAGGPKGMIKGQVEGKLAATGRTADPNALAGEGEIYLRDGEVRQYSLLVALGQLLQIDELSQLRFQQAHVKYHITPGVVNVDELILSSPNIRVASHGTIDFKGKLRLDSQLAIDERIRSQLFRGMQQSFRPIEQPGFAAVDFHVSGSVEKPKTDLVGKLLGRDLKDLGGVISTFLGGGKHKVRRETESEPPPAPEAQPTPVEAQATPDGPQPTSTP